ncbi:putative bifunctional diguanylate cyclase/phosphodiesterase [Idiomarina sp. HP20-50]|uniref:putative bifunctional diguanylate cyclase/phosphodiesterase n=1 Tax=Idiomarina sp. HP20-50 TaxID=3070813 RepID=UPI00294AA9E8|nr:EAL domain-containing protein [Idiomarina sp. HP20-50]MDV6316718.1 EAL domain-containing protein [Idiomarina sp. HP20-50]
MSARDIANARVLIVDDNQTNIELLIALLEEAGYQYLEGIQNPRHIDEKMASFKPDLILLDYKMPELSGADVLEHMNQNYGEDAPPVVMLTAQNDKKIRLRSLELGAVDFLTKPFDYEEILQRLRNILEVHYRSQARRDASLFFEAIASERSAELEELVLEDMLTGLPNRRAILQEVGAMVRSEKGCSVVFLVIDELEEVAQLHGYPLAEAFTRELALLLQSKAPARSFIGSWGQQEYVVVFEAKLDDDLMTKGHQLVDVASGDHDYETLLFTIAARAGISSTLDRGMEPDELVRQASLALPKKGTNLVGLFSDQLHRDLAERISLRNDLRAALESNALQLFYQPKYDLTTGKITSAEALIRWRHADKGFISPALFIPLAEETGDIRAVGDWVTEHAIKQLARWNKQSVVDENFVLAINVSPQQMVTGTFASDLLECCSRHDVEPRQVQVEITESAFMQNVVKVQRELEILTQAGVTVAMDDFGTGYSSLSYLRNLPISVIKIDRSFVMNLVSDLSDQQLVGTIVLMAHNFKCSIVAEGIETVEQAKLLVKMSCNEGQGFLFSKPIAQKEFEDLVQSPAHSIESYLNS